MEEIKIRIPRVEIPAHLEGDGGFSGGGNYWSDSTLRTGAELLEEFDVPLSSLNLCVSPWSMSNFRWILYHIRRIENADLRYPILLDPDGSVADGWHRIAKAILNGDLTIKAKRFSVMPEADTVSTSTK